MVFANIIKTLFLHSMRYSLPHLPHSVLVLLADGISGVSKRSQQAAIIRGELTKLLGERKTASGIEHATRESIANYRKDLFEIWSFPKLNKKKMEELAYIEGLEHLDRALEKGNGALIGLSHFGSWKIIIPALAFKGYKVNQIGLDPRFFIDDKRPVHHNKIMEIEYECEQSLPADFIYVGDGKSIRPVFRKLQSNEVVLHSFDGFMGSRRKQVSFFDSSLYLSAGPVLVALKSGAPLIPSFAVRDKDSRHRIVIHEEIPLDKSENEQQTLDKAVNSYASLLEHYVTEYPSHYGRILYDRFRDPRR